MRNFLAFVAAMVVVFLGLGWYLGWYNILLEPSGPGHSRLEVDINKDKIGQDVQQGVKKGSEKVQEFLDKNKQAPNSGADEKPSSSLLPPPPGANKQETKTADRSQEKLRDFITDGWLSPPKK
jgi:ribosomal protein S16